VKKNTFFADGSPLQLTLRELQALLLSPTFWGVLVAGTIVVAIAAPFGTGEAFSFIQRLFYWGAIGLFTYLPAMVVSMFVSLILKGRGVPERLSLALGGLAASIPVVAIVLIISNLVVGMPLSILPSIPLFLLQCAAISVAVVAVHYLLRTRTEDVDPAVGRRPQASSLQSRLPLAVRGPVQHLEMQDHYVRVTTEKGSELVLMRMADAIADLGGEDGLQVHRSHWVAKNAVVSSRREKGRVVLTLPHGTEVPVSRTFAPAVKEAKLI
jgi:DNA-binding LytR/AlgR family response regulator